QDVVAADPVAAAATAADQALRRDAPGVPGGIADVDQQTEVGNGAAHRKKCVSRWPNRWGARKPPSSPFRLPWPDGPACWPRPGRCRISVNTASAGSGWPASAP